MQDHLSKLRNNKHPNLKLQAAWNKYGEENFIIEKQKYNLTKQQLNEKEIEEIQLEDSIQNGYNLTLGGDGGNTRGILTFEEYCFIYFGNIKYQGMTNRTATYLGIDSSTVSTIARKKSYLWFQEQAESLCESKKEEYLQKFEEAMQIKDKPPVIQSKKMNDEDIVKFLCVVSAYGRGAEAAMTRFLGRAKGLKHHIVKGEYKEARIQFQQLSDQEIYKIADEIFITNNLQQYCSRTIQRNTEIIRPSFNCAP